jgi:hypothetical protein
VNRSAAGKIASVLCGLVFRFAAALCVLMAASYVFKNAKFLPPPNIPNAAVISVLGTPGFLLLISLKLLF